MNHQERAWFEQLSASRKEDAKTFAKPEFQGVWERIVDMYKESAHFVYELLQNADDAGATEASFELFEDRLLFRHNGSKRFSISNPDSVEEDRKNGRLGSVNSITAGGFSSKSDEKCGNSIGKFGIGFKSVFVYTDSPQIYDPNICFRITEKIVPELLSDSSPDWNGKETLFVLPFNKREKSPEKAYEEIQRQIAEMQNPVLFLNNLKKVRYAFSGESLSGEFVKTVKKKKSVDDGTIAELVTLSRESSEQKRKLWLFSRQTEMGKISIGFGVDDGRLIPLENFAYCFFETKENTDLKFILHAPFLLTPDRQHIKDNEGHNALLMDALSRLAADCFVYLRKFKVPMGNEILEIVPICWENYYSYELGYYFQKKIKPKTIFAPFYDKILAKFKTEELLPTKSGYTVAANAYRPVESALQNVFSDADLSGILGDNSSWAFPELKTQQYLDKDKREWIQKIIGLEHLLNDERFIERIPGKFVEKKFAESSDWFLTFYSWMDENSKRFELAKTRPIFVNQNGKAACAFSENGTLSLFLPNGEENDFPTIHKTLYGLKREKEAKPFFVEEFCKKLGMSAPSLKSEIETKILPRYRGNVPAVGGGAVGRDFQKILRYFLDECPQSEIEKWRNKIRTEWLVLVKVQGSDEICWHRQENIYFDSPELREWFSNSSNIFFLDLEFYSQFDERAEKFFELLGVRRSPSPVIKTLDCYGNDSDYGIVWNDFQFDHYLASPRSVWAEFHVIDGMEDFVKSELSWERSKVFAEILLKELDVLSEKIECIWRCSLWKEYPGYPRSECRPVLNWLRKQKWMLTTSGEFKAPNEICVEDLDERYNAIPDWKKLVDVLDIQTRPRLNLAEDYPEVQKQLDELNAFKEKCGGKLPDETQWNEFLEWKKKCEEKSGARERSGGTSGNRSAEVAVEEDAENPSSEIAENPQKRIWEKIETFSKEKEPESSAENADETLTDAEEPSYDSEKEIQKAERKLALETNLIAAKDDACRKALSAKKYSFGWFQAMLQLEILNGTKNAQNKQKEIFIQFGRVAVDKESRRTLILSRPNKRIPAAVENLYGMNLHVRFRDGSEKNLPFEAASIHSFSLRLKMMHAGDLQNLDAENIAEASIAAKSPEFLLQELQEQFGNLRFNDDFDMHENLCKNIRFVFGPPGTGKTTYLVEKELLPLVADKSLKNVLVLAPTNKAADVLTRRLMDKSPEYRQFLTRFGTTEDSEIEKDAIFCGRGWNPEGRETNIVVTTIARLPYDSCVVGSSKRFLREIPWDAIVVDEASMIPLIHIVYLLHSQKPRQFVIAGDPFQIAPMFSERSWQKENIYTMVGLDEVDSFKNPRTSPYAYEVVRLQRQYRSIPEIGEIFSRLTYGGLLEHERPQNSRKRLVVNGKEIGPLNIIRFPVSNYESIYRSKRLKTSGYHIYSALFAYEYVRHLATALSGAERDRLSVGVVSPYRIQADVIENLLRSWQKPDGVSVQCGTVHRFQGDECDVMFVVLNPSASISSQSFLNQLNLINVAVSRARDGLFVLMPDADTKNLEKLEVVNRLKSLLQEMGCKEMEAREIENEMLGSPTFLEENVFTTGHQSVNVYGKPERRYEVRSEDEAVDIQLMES